MEINGFAPKDVRIVLTDAQAAQLYIDRVTALELENSRLEAKIERLYSFLGLKA